MRRPSCAITKRTTRSPSFGSRRTFVGKERLHWRPLTNPSLPRPTNLTVGFFFLRINWFRFGAVSLEGTFAGCIAASIAAWTATLAGIVEWRWAPVIAVAGIAGMLLDSVLGACLENRGKMGNDSVNFVSTVFAADSALIATLLLPRH